MLAPWIDVDEAFRDAVALRRRALRNFRGLDGRHGLRTLQTDAPRLSFTEDEGGWTLCADLPGVAREDVQLHVERGQLELVVQRRLQVPEGYTVRYRERREYTLRRVWRLPEAADPERIEASFRDGVLTVRLPRAEAQLPRRIEIKD